MNDEQAFRQIVIPALRMAVARLPQHERDQAEAAIREGDVRFRYEDAEDGSPIAVFVVGERIVRVEVDAAVLAFDEEPEGQGS